MEVIVEGQIFKVTQKKDKSGFIVNILIPRADKQSDQLTIFTSKDGYKAGTIFKGKVNFYSDMCNEVVG